MGWGMGDADDDVDTESRAAEKWRGEILWEWRFYAYRCTTP